MTFQYGQPDDRIKQPPGVRNPFASNDDASEFGVERGRQERLARSGLAPNEGGVYRALSPGRARRAGKQTGHPGERVRE